MVEQRGLLLAAGPRQEREPFQRESVWGPREQSQKSVRRTREQQNAHGDEAFCTCHPEGERGLLEIPRGRPAYAKSMRQEVQRLLASAASQLRTLCCWSK